MSDRSPRRASSRAAPRIRAVRWAAAALLLTGPAHALDLDEAVRAGVEHHPAVTGAGHDLDAARAERAATALNYRPKLRTEANVLVWDDEQVLSLGGGGAAIDLPPPQTPYEEVVAGLISAFGQPTTVRNQVTADLKVQIIQPVAGLWLVAEAVGVADDGVEAARLSTEAVREKIALSVTEAYLRVQQAEALRQTTDAAVESLSAREHTVLALAEHGVVGQNEVLRIQVALQAARQDAVAAADAVRTARAGLALAMGRPVGADESLAAAAPGWADAPLPPDASPAKRPDLQVARARARQAEGAIDVERARGLPDLNLVGQYEHTEGNELANPNALFVGATLSWSAFEWGATGQRTDAARSRAASAQAGLVQAEAGAAFEVESARNALHTAEGRLAVADGSIALAEESARLEQARFEAQQATAADVVEAETALTRARLSREAARFDRLIYLARLRHALGLPLTGGES